MAFATDPRAVAEQAGLVAAAWSGPGTPPSWQLTAAQFEALRDDDELAGLAAAIPLDKLLPLLFSAAATFLVLLLRPEPLRGWFPTVGEPQPPLGAAFRDEYRRFCLDHRDRLLELCAEHRYQMNEVGRCADIVPALATLVSGGRDFILVDVGTGAGLGLNLDRYHYLYRGPGDRRVAVGDQGSALSIEVELRGQLPPAVSGWISGAAARGRRPGCGPSPAPRTADLDRGLCRYRALRRACAAYDGAPASQPPAAKPPGSACGECAAPGSGRLRRDPPPRVSRPPRDNRPCPGLVQMA